MHGGEPLIPPDEFAVSLAVAEAQLAGYDCTRSVTGVTMLRQAAEIGMPVAPATPQNPPHFGSNEFQVIARYSNGMPPADIKADLNIRERTLWAALNRMRDRFPARTNALAVRWLVELGMLEGNVPHPALPVPRRPELDEFLTLSLSSHGLTPANIATQLDYSVSAINGRNARAFDKLGTANIEHAVRRAFGMGLLATEATLLSWSKKAGAAPAVDEEER